MDENYKHAQDQKYYYQDFNRNSIMVSGRDS